MMNSEVALGQVDGAYGYYHDAMLFSRTYQAGTARMQGIGGAQMSLGGDLSAGNANPAGLGFFRRSAISITPSLNVHQSNTEYLGTETEDYRTNFNVGQLGAAFSHEGTGSKYKGGAFAITFTRVNDFYNDTYLDGYNNENSIIDSYIDRAWGIPEDQLQGDLYDAYNHYLINPYTATDPETNEEFTAYDSFVTGFPRQRENIRTTGKQNQWDFSYGGNFDDILFFGLSLGLNTIDYYQESSYYESEFEENGEPDEALNLYNTTNTLKIDGLGVNSTFGLIIVPNHIFRFGLAAKTPTYYSMKEESSESFYTEYNNYPYAPDTTVLNDFYDEYTSNSKYELRTPWKFSAGGSVFIGKSGFISADVDFLNYANMNLKGRNFDTQADNETIASIYQSTINYRVGGEFRVGQMRFRAGYNYMGDPYADSEIDNSIRKISGGIGYRNQNMFLDLSVVHTSSESLRTPYLFYDGSGPTSYVENSSINTSVTLGFNF